LQSNARWLIRLMAAVTAALFLLSSVMNLGAKIPLGFTELSFTRPLTQIGEFEVVIGVVLLVAALLSSPYLYAGAFLLALVGIAFGLASADVQGLARSLHEAMLPFVIGGSILLALETRTTYRRSKVSSSGDGTRRVLITALQFFTSALVVIGGTAFAEDATYPVGTILGLIHLFAGLAGLIAGFAFVKRMDWSRRAVIVTNVVIIVYSAFSETLAQIYAFLPQGVGDALIGTIIAIIVSAAILYLLPPSEAGSRGRR
jgi:hypothetical protein